MLPDKSFNAGYAETQHEKRSLKLKQWLDRVIAHPVLGRDELSLRVFLTVAQEKDKASDNSPRPTTPGFFKKSTIY